MNAPLQITEARALPPLIDILRLMAESAASSWCLHPLDLDEVIDPLQWFAAKTGLVAAIGQDAVQELISEPFAWVRGAELPLEEIDVVALEPSTADDPAPPRYRTPQATVDAFLYVARNESTEYLRDWLAQHPLDAPYLLEIWEQRCTGQ